MKRGRDSIIIPGTTAFLATLLIVASLGGLLTPGFYAAETLNWKMQSLAQDRVDLFLITPLLIITGILSAKKNRNASLLWAGVLLYIIYTFIIYCFAVHFNSLFPIYCLILGVSFYSFLWFIYRQVKFPPGYRPVINRVTQFTGIYFIIIAVLFYFLWLSEIIPSAVKNTIPESLKLSGLPANPVHVIDLSVLLPAVFVTGIFLLRKNPRGSVFAVILLCFFILMDITIGWIAFSMNQERMDSGGVIVFAMLALTIISASLLIYNLKRDHSKTELAQNKPFKRMIIKMNTPD